MTSNPDPITPAAATSADAGPARLTRTRGRPVRVTEEIIESLRADIALGRLTAGERLPTERELARHFGVSQPTIRESVRVLEAMGLVDVRHGSGVYVNRASHEFVATSLHTLLQMESVGILDVVDLRDVLARYSAARAVHHATDDDIDEIERRATALEDALQANNADALLDAILAFLAAVSAAAHSPLLLVLENVLNTLVTTLEIIAFNDREPAEFWGKWMLDLSAEREQFVASLRARDEEAAVAARVKYLEALRARIASVPELANLRLSDAEATRMLNAAGLRI